MIHSITSKSAGNGSNGVSHRQARLQSQALEFVQAAEKMDLIDTTLKADILRLIRDFSLKDEHGNMLPAKILALDHPDLVRDIAWTFCQIDNMCSAQTRKTEAEWAKACLGWENALNSEDAWSGKVTRAVIEDHAKLTEDWIVEKQRLEQFNALKSFIEKLQWGLASRGHMIQCLIGSVRRSEELE